VSFDELRTNDEWGIPFVVSLSNHKRNRLVQHFRRATPRSAVNATRSALLSHCCVSGQDARGKKIGPADDRGVLKTMQEGKSVQEYEKLGAFYLGKEVDAQTGERTEDQVLYDSRDLTTHGVIIGMTGSGKTGLGVALLEEAAMDRIPVLAVDPKGDLTNLLLTFPELEAADFRPWINEDAARQRGQDPDAYAAGQAELWRKGLKDWDQDGERIRRLRDQTDFAIYTPGSEAGLPVSVLRSFDAPAPELVADADGFRERVQTAVTGLLGLLGLDADPVRSREHILLSSILDDAWRKGRNLDLGALIQAIQQPPFTRLGVMELESVYPAKDRFALAMQLNALLASPGFQSWMTGEPLDIGAMLYTPEGKPRLTVFSIAHLGDAERMFFVTMLLSAVLGWMRGQSGTTSLRALVYMDEIFGFFPPNANPPSKTPMLTLLKQARAFGVGMVLATQNPVDLDYKGLGNTGTWFIGRLQTERDKMRVLEALDGAMAGSNPIPRQELDRMISGLGSRVFLMHNVHRGAPKLMTTRWVMSYLAGPLTLTQIRTLMAPRKVSGAAAAPTLPGQPEPAGTPGLLTSRPILPNAIRQFFVPPFAAVEGLQYRPALLAAIDVRYSSARHGVEETRHLQPIVELGEGPLAFSTDRAALVDLPLDLLDAAPAGQRPVHAAARGGDQPAQLRELGPGTAALDPGVAAGHAVQFTRAQGRVPPRRIRTRFPHAPRGSRARGPGSAGRSVAQAVRVPFPDPAGAPAAGRADSGDTDRTIPAGKAQRRPHCRRRGAGGTRRQQAGWRQGRAAGCIARRECDAGNRRSPQRRPSGPDATGSGPRAGDGRGRAPADRGPGSRPAGGTGPAGGIRRLGGDAGGDPRAPGDERDDRAPDRPRVAAVRAGHHWRAGRALAPAGHRGQLTVFQANDHGTRHPEG
jgi:hypothetical protein